MYQPACCVRLLHASRAESCGILLQPLHALTHEFRVRLLVTTVLNVLVLSGTTLTSPLLQDPQTLPHIISAHLLLIILGYVHTALLLQLPHVPTDGIKLPFQGLQSSATVPNVILPPGEVQSLQGATH